MRGDPCRIRRQTQILKLSPIDRAKDQRDTGEEIAVTKHKLQRKAGNRYNQVNLSSRVTFLQISDEAALVWLRGEPGEVQVFRK